MKEINVDLFWKNLIENLNFVFTRNKVQVDLKILKILAGKKKLIFPVATFAPQKHKWIAMT